MADRVETIGIYSAYGFAKEAGYTGTKAEFEQGLKNSAEYADNAASSANVATNAKNVAVTAKTDAQAAQSAAETAQGLAEDARAAAEDAQSAAEAAAASLDASTIARIDGFYENMGVGTADQLMASQKVHNSDPYIFRTSGGTSDIGNREELEIVGGSIVWNQGVSFHANKIPSARNGLTFTKDGDACIISGTVDGAMTASGWFSLSEGSGFLTDDRLNHALLIITKHISGTVTDNAVMLNGSSVAFGGVLRIGNNRIFKMGGEIGEQHRISINSPDGTVFDNYKFTMTCFDLTQMFGSEIADHVYELEQAEAGAGVAWFRKYFPNDYYAYNTGELMHVSDLQSHDTVGFNLWDEEWEVGTLTQGVPQPGTSNIRSKNYNRILPDTTYYAKFPTGTKMYLALYDANMGFLGYADGFFNSSTTFTTPSNAMWFKFLISSAYGTTYKHDICINLSWSGTRDDEYEPYVKHSYPLDSSLTLRGIPKLTTDGDLTYDGDIYKSDGTIERRYGIVDLGTLEWRYNIADQSAFTSYTIKDQVASNDIVCSTAYGHIYNFSSSQLGSIDKGIGINKVTTGTAATGNFLTGAIVIKDSSYTDVATFKAAMSGVYLVYELAEPTTEEAEPYTSPQIVDDWGTEEFVTTSIVPVGHNTSYPANLRDKLQHLPDLPDNDGYYMTQVTGTQMGLVRFRIPQAPAEDGTYVLKAAVSGGTPTYTWEAVVEAEGGEG